MLARPRRDQELPWCATCASTASRLNEAGFCRGGNLAKSWTSTATPQDRECCSSRWLIEDQSTAALYTCASVWLNVRHYIDRPLARFRRSFGISRGGLSTFLLIPQCLPPAQVWELSCILRSTSSRLKLAAFWRCGYSLNVCRNCPTKACAGTSRKTWSTNQS
jgi:hypothetical protein